MSSLSSASNMSHDARRSSVEKTARGILCALHDLRKFVQSSKDGVSERVLAKILEDEYCMSSNCMEHIKPVLKHGIKFGVIRKLGNKYVLGNVFPSILEARGRSKRQQSKSRRRKGGARRRLKRQRSKSRRRKGGRKGSRTRRRSTSCTSSE